MKIRPLQDRLIVERLAPEETTRGGLIIPALAQERPLQGKVLAVGNGKLLEGGGIRPLDIKAGDVVLFAKYAGTEVQVDGKEQLMLREEDILGVVEK